MTFWRFIAELPKKVCPTASNARSTTTNAYVVGKSFPIRPPTYQVGKTNYNIFQNDSNHATYSSPGGPPAGEATVIINGPTNITSAIIHDYNGHGMNGAGIGGGAAGNQGIVRRGASTLEFGFGSGPRPDGYLTSSFYEVPNTISRMLHPNFHQWGAGFYARPLIAESEDTNSPSAVEQRWRAQRNDRILQEAWELNDPTLNQKTDTQISILDNETEVAALLVFHPFENTMVVADNADSLSVSTFCPFALLF